MLKIIFPLLGLLLASMTRADNTDPEPPGGSAEALRALKGTWTVLGDRSPQARPGMTYTFDGTKLTRVIPSAKGKGAQGGKRKEVKGKVMDNSKRTFQVKLDTTKKPHRITLKSDLGGPAQEGIFKVEKGELFIATSRGGAAKVPEGFSGDGVSVLVLKKDKK